MRKVGTEIITLIVGKRVLLPLQRWVVAMSLDRNAIGGVKSVDYTLKLIEPLKKCSEKADDGFYVDFEFGEKDCNGEVKIRLDNGQCIPQKFSLKDEQQCIQIQIPSEIKEIPPNKQLTNEQSPKIGKARPPTIT